MVGAGVHRLETDGEDRWRWTAGPVPFYVPVADTIQSIQVDGDVAPTGPACRLVNSAGIYLRADGYAGDVGIATPDDGRFDEAADRFGVSFTAVVFRRSTWDRLGALPSPYFAYYEDVDWCWRAQLAGLRIRYEPRTRVVHRWSATSGGASGPGVRVLSESNRTLTIVRNAPPRTGHGPSAVALERRSRRGRQGEGPAPSPLGAGQPGPSTSWTVEVEPRDGVVRVERPQCRLGHVAGDQPASVTSATARTRSAACEKSCSPA